jgi:hypothetical protein
MGKIPQVLALVWGGTLRRCAGGKRLGLWVMTWLVLEFDMLVHINSITFGYCFLLLLLVIALGSYYWFSLKVSLLVYGINSISVSLQDWWLPQNICEGGGNILDFGLTLVWRQLIWTWAKLLILSRFGPFCYDWILQFQGLRGGVGSIVANIRYND